MNNNRIFIVDDEPDLTMLFKLGLEDNGFEVDAFNGPRIALSAFKERPSYDLALIDIRMPEMNGFQLYDEMKKLIVELEFALYHHQIKNLLSLFENLWQLKKWWKK